MFGVSVYVVDFYGRVVIEFNKEIVGVCCVLWGKFWISGLWRGRVLVWKFFDFMNIKRWSGGYGF